MVFKQHSNILCLIIEYVDYTEEDLLIALKLLLEYNCINYILDKPSYISNYIKNRINKSFYIIRNILNIECINALQNKFKLTLKDNNDIDTIKNILTAQFMEHKNDNYKIINKKDYLINYYDKECKTITTFLIYCDNKTNLNIFSTYLTYKKNVIFFGSIEKIEDNILNNNLMTSINLSGLTKLKHIGNNFLYSNNNLKNINLNGLDNLISIGSKMLSFSCSLEYLNIKNMKNLESIGSHFMQKSHNFKHLYLHNCPNLKNIGKKFMSRCYKFNELEICKCINLCNIGEKFLYQCDNIYKLKVSKHKNLTKIGSHFLFNCKKLGKLKSNLCVDTSDTENDFLIKCDRIINPKKRKIDDDIHFPQKVQII